MYPTSHGGPRVELHSRKWLHVAISKLVGEYDIVCYRFIFAYLYFFSIYSHRLALFIRSSGDNGENDNDDEKYKCYAFYAAVHLSQTPVCHRIIQPVR